MSAKFTVNQTGKPAGVEDRARSDLDLSTTVTLTASNNGVSYRFRVLSKPKGSTAAPVSTTPLDPGETDWTISLDRVGSYRVQLIEDEGLVTESRVTRVLAVRTANTGIRIPAHGEKASRVASAVFSNAQTIAASEFNENGSDTGWTDAYEEAFLRLDSVFISSKEFSVLNGPQETGSDTPISLGMTVIQPGVDYPTDPGATYTAVAEVIAYVTGTVDASITIRNHTTSTLLATIPVTGSTATLLTSSPITLASGQNIYEVRHNLDTLGLITDRSIVLMARIKVSWVY